MSGLVIREGVLWRQLTSCLVIYTLIIQGLLLGFVGAQAAAGDNGSGYELCLNGDHDSPSGDIPDGQAGSDGCSFCIAAAFHALPVPSFASSWRSYAVAVRPLPVLRASALLPNSEQPGAPTRGPPLAA